MTRWQGPVSEEDDPYPNPAEPDNVQIREGKVPRKHIQDITKADFNGNNAVDIIDIATMAKNYNKTERAVDWNLNYDPNDDGVVDIYDMIRISKLIGMQ